MLKALFYDDEAEEGNAELRELITIAQSVLGDGVRFTVSSNAIEAREWIRKQEKMPAVLILDIKNEDRRTYLSSIPVPLDKYENSGLILARDAYRKWPSAKILYLTRLDYGGAASDEADKALKVHQWVEKKGHGTAIQLQHKLLAWFPKKEVYQIGRLTLVVRELTVYYGGVPMKLASNVKSKKNQKEEEKVYLTPELFSFLSTLITKTDEKRAAGAADCTVSLDELRPDEDTEDPALHTAKFELCKRFMKAEAVLQKVKVKDARFDCADVIVAGYRGYLMVEQ